MKANIDMRDFKILFKLVLIDYYAFIFICVPIIFCILAIIPYFLKDFIFSRGWKSSIEFTSSSSQFFLIAFIITLPVFIFLLILRVKYLFNILKDGITTKALVKEVFSYQDRIKVIYIYQVEKVFFTQSCMLMKSPLTSFIKPNTEVEIKYNPKNPFQTFFNQI